ncbi:MAG: glycosyltransferase [Ferruginibacter sp.]
MIEKKINKIAQKNNVLVVPLDWGLGHATRCIPLIRQFIANGCNVIIAAENATKSLLQHEFQQLTFIPFRGYRIGYSRNSNRLPFKILSQLPGLLLNVYREHKWLKKVVKNYSINAVIADNRFGLYYSGVPTVYITHQLLIKTGRNFTEKIAQRIHYWFIKKYTFCWVPDFEGVKNIAGDLSHPPNKPSNITYIGCLSRFEKTAPAGKKYDALILISGPEPQRSIFENLLLQQLPHYDGNILLVRGLPGTNESPEKVIGLSSRDRLTIKNHLSAEELNKALEQAELVISRSGFTSIMDFVKLQQKAILVPTPGQTEQEYLALHLMKQDIFFATSQDGFILTDALKQAADFPFTIPSFNMEQYKKVVDEFVRSL